MKEKKLFTEFEDLVYQTINKAKETYFEYGENYSFVSENNFMKKLNLVEQINIFREQEGNRKELQHNDLLKIIRDEFEDEMHEGKISQMFYDLKIGNGATIKDIKIYNSEATYIQL